MNAVSFGQPALIVRAMEPVALELLGKPTTVTRHDLTFGTRGSMCISLDKGTWFDHEANEGGGVLDLVMKRCAVDKPGAMAWLQERRHLPALAGLNIVATYDYTDAEGRLLFQVCRLDPKSFRQRKPDGAGGWVWKMAGVQRVLYRLPALIEAVAAGRTVFVVEGEKAADRLAALGLVATCSPGGANKWRPEYGAPLAGANVVLLPDNDDPGRKHAASVAKALGGAQSRAARVRVLSVPNLPEKGDVADWIATGGTAEQLIALANAAENGVELLARDLGEGSRENDDPPFELTEDGVALAFTARHGDALRYCHQTGEWFYWTGAIWQQQKTKLAYSWARRTCRDAAKGLPVNDRARVGKAAFAAAVERFAQSDETLAVTVDRWDRDPFLLGTPGGTVDLRTTELRPAVRSDYITKATAVTPAAVPDCPLWEAFLNQTTAGDAGLIRFLRQWCGYSLTGDTREHALLFGFGPGGNGKSVFLNTVASIMGDYARTAAMETFTASQGDRHPTDLAMLRGARLVCASETEEGRAWAETRIKQLTGGDTIAARFMRQDFFEFRPQFKLTVIGNHKPVLRNVDDAARRRFNVVPFLHKPANPDRELEAKLRAEWPAILRWMIEGALDWQMNGLVRPAIVTDATAEYFEAQDHFSRWLAECCDLIPTMSTKPSHLLASFIQWCHANGEPNPDNRKLRGMIEKMPGLRYATNGGTQFVRGVGLKPDTKGWGVEGSGA